MFSLKNSLNAYDNIEIFTYLARNANAFDFHGTSLAFTQSCLTPGVELKPHLLTVLFTAADSTFHCCVAPAALY